MNDDGDVSVSSAQGIFGELSALYYELANLGSRTAELQAALCEPLSEAAVLIAMERFALCWTKVDERLERLVSTTSDGLGCPLCILPALGVLYARQRGLVAAATAYLTNGGRGDQVRDQLAVLTARLSMLERIQEYLNAREASAPHYACRAKRVEPARRDRNDDSQ